MSTILVTGGAGFIGSNFIHYILENYDDQIINFDKLTYAGNLDNLKDIEDNDNYKFVKGDICNRDLVEDIIDDSIDYIVNFAAESHVDRSIAGAGIFVETNVRGTQVLLEVAKEYDIKKFVQISTDEVYGSLGDTGYFTEESPLKPNSPYSASKASADLMVRAYNKTYGLPINITRSSNNFGPYQYPEKLIPLFVTNAMEDKKLPVYGDGKNVRDWLYVEDNCRAIDVVMREGEIGEIYNIGGDNEMTNFAITQKILEVLEKPSSLINYVEDRPGHDYRYAINSSKIKNELNWKPDYEFYDSLVKTVLWYNENKRWWNKLK